MGSWPSVNDSLIGKSSTRTDDHFGGILGAFWGQDWQFRGSLNTIQVKRGFVVSIVQTVGSNVSPL